MGPAPMLLKAGLPVAAQLALVSRGKTTRHLPPVFAAIDKALALSGEFFSCPLHQFGVDVLPLLQLLHVSQHLCHFPEFLLCGGTMEAINLAFAPCHIEGSTTKNRHIVAIALAIAITPLCPGAAAIVQQAIQPLQNQLVLWPALKPWSHLLSPPPLCCKYGMHDQ